MGVAWYERATCKQPQQSVSATAGLRGLGASNLGVAQGKRSQAAEHCCVGSAGTHRTHAHGEDDALEVTGSGGGTAQHTL